MSLSLGTIVLLFVITIGDFMNAMETNREPSKDVINLLSMAITGIVGIIAGFISGKNAADQAKQQSEIRNKVKLILWSLVFMVMSSVSFASDFVTKGDINKSSIGMFKSFFTKEKCDQILIDTFTICYDYDRNHLLLFMWK